MPAQLALVLVVAVLAAANVLNNRVFPAAYPVTGLVAAAFLVAIAQGAGLGYRGLGLGRGSLVPGLRWALLVLGFVAVLYALGAALPWTQGLFLDRRVAGAGAGQVAYQVLLRIPLGTVLLEEVAFRGVLYGLLLRERGVVAATVGSSVLFGLWHVLPALATLPSHPLLQDRLGGAGVMLTIVGAVLATALGGVLFCELRRLSGSLLAPLGLHYAFNGLGFLIAALVTARD
ncbi:MAG: lysostaphin resistance A-like protein [Carbonactinosporaceae bacterium]